MKTYTNSEALSLKDKYQFIIGKKYKKHIISGIFIRKNGSDTSYVSVLLDYDLNQGNNLMEELDIVLIYLNNTKK